MSDGDRQPVYLFEGFRLDARRRVLFGSDGQPIPLTSRLFDTLLYLVERPGQLVTKEQLLEAIWPHAVVEEQSLGKAISALRKALGEKPEEHRFIVTKHGRGYRFVAHVAIETRSEDPAIARHDAASPIFARRTPRRRSIGAAVALVGATIALVTVDLWRIEPAPRLGSVNSFTTLTSYVGEETTPALSPDGTRVAFSWDGETGNRDIYVVQIATGSRMRLTSSTDGFDHFPVWSPDGEFIAFLRQHDASHVDVIALPSLGGAERKLFSAEQNWIGVEGSPLIAWTPDSQQLWFTHRYGGPNDPPSYGLHRLALSTGNAEPASGMSGDGRDYDTSPAISPDGKWLAFTRYRKGERLNQIMLQPLGAQYTPSAAPERITGVEPGIHHSLAWSPDAKALRFVNGGQLFEWAFGGVPRVVHTAGPQRSLGTMTFARNGTVTRAAVVTRRADTDVFALPLDPLAHSAVGSPKPRVRSTAVENHPRVSPDGTTLAFVSDRNGRRALWLADMDGGNERQLTDLDQLITGFPRWSPDGSRIAFHTSAANEHRIIYSVDVAGGPPKRLANGCCPGGWSSDGRQLYIHEPDRVNRIARIDVADGSRELLFEGETAIESLDGRYILYAKSSERGYFRRSLHGNPAENSEERLVEDYTPAMGGLVPVGDGFYYVGLGLDDRPRAFRFYDYERGEARDVALAPASVVIGLSLTSDGRELLYAALSEEPAADLVLLEFGNFPAN